MQYPNLITLLGEVDRSELLALRKRHIDQKVFSDAREMGGATASPTSDPPASDPRNPLLDLASVSCSKLRAPMDDLAKNIQAKMRTVARLKFLGALVALLAGGVGAVASFLGLGHQFTALCSAILGMLGGATGLLASNFEQAPSGIRIAGSEEYAKLVAMIGAIQVMQTQIERDKVRPLSKDDLDGMLVKLDEYSVAMLRLKHA